MRRISLRLYIAVLASCILIAGSYEAGVLLAAHRSVSNPCPRDRGETSSCWIAYYESLIANKGTQSALRDLKIRYEKQDPAATFCHPLLHVIGEAAAAEFGTVRAAFAHGETFCRSGYYHGVLEGVFEGGKDPLVLQNMNTLCADIRTSPLYTYDYFSCVHGIGHGLMAYFYHDLLASLKGCDALQGEWEQSSCYGGVFMENVLGDSPDEPSLFLSREDVVFPCNVVDDVYREQCFLMQTSHMLSVMQGDFKKTFAVCARVEEKYRTTCFQSIGRDASGWSYGSEDAVVVYCAQGATVNERGACMEGAAVDYMQSVGPRAAISLCARTEVETREACEKAVALQISML